MTALELFFIFGNRVQFERINRSGECHRKPVLQARRQLISPCNRWISLGYG